MTEDIFRSYDIRGRYPENVNEKIIEQIAYACGKVLRGHIVIARDVRLSSPQLLRSVVKGLKRAKVRHITEAGVATTPMFYFLVNRESASGGLMVTASHNPKEYNGLKVVGKGAEMIGGGTVLNFVKRYSHET